MISNNVIPLPTDDIAPLNVISNNVIPLSTDDIAR